MAHNLNQKKDGTYSFVATYENGEKAWHGLGTYVDKAMTAEEAIKLAGLDYEVKPYPLYAHDENGNVLGKANRVGLVRTDTNDVLGEVTERYGIVQNRDCFGFLDSIIEAGEAVYETAGALGKGETIFLTAKLPDDIVINGDKIDGYFMLTNGHGSKRALQAMITPVRVVCNNTLNAALSQNSNHISFKHTSGVRDRMKEGARLMGLASKYLQEVTEVYEAMSKTRITDDQLYDYIVATLKPQREQIEDKEFHAKFLNNVDKVYDFALTHDTQRTKATKGTLFGAFNAITGAQGWLKEYKSAEQRLKNITFGNGATQTQRAFDIAVSMLN